MFRMTVKDLFSIRGRGAVITGQVESGEVRVGDTVQINHGPVATVDGIEISRKRVDMATVGDTVGLLFSAITNSYLAAGDLITSVGARG